MMKTRNIIFGLFLCLMAAVAGCFAQSATSGAIGGTIYDSTGAAIAGAAITATSSETGYTFKATSSDSGNSRKPRTTRHTSSTLLSPSAH